MYGTLIVFTVPTGSNRTKSSAFVKQFYGQDSSSHNRKYRYHRHGLLDDIPYRKLIRGVIIVRGEDAPQIIAFLKQHLAQFYLRSVILTSEDCKELGIAIE